MNDTRSIVIVGASAAGLTTAESLRRDGFGGTITLVGAERHLPYDRPPLSKEILSGDWPIERAMLRTEEQLGHLNVRFLLDKHAVALDVPSQFVLLDDGMGVPYDILVIATGARPRTLAEGHQLKGVHVLRTLEDARALHADLRPGARFLIVGAGFLGSEAGASARRMGIDVTIVDPLPQPMVRQFGPLVGAVVADQHRENGVDLRLETGLGSLSGDRSLTGAELTTGEALDVDVALIAIGAVPNTEWLEGSGLTIDNGVVCDAYCRAAPNVYAAGDVARWFHPGLGRLVRVEHRMHATEQAMAVAQNILGESQPFAPVPYFWSDQYASKIQAFGWFPPEAQPVVAAGSLAERKFLLHYVTEGKVVGALGWNMPREIRQARQAVVTDAVAV